MGSVSCITINNGAKRYLAMAVGFGLLLGVPKKKESDTALLARLKRDFAKPYLTKSVKENATKKQIASWNAR